MSKINHHLSNKKRRSLRVHHRVQATKDQPKLVITRSNKSIYLQVINYQGQIITSDSDHALIKAGKIKNNLTKTQKAQQTGESLAGKLKKQKIKKLAIDRGANKFHGRIKAAVEALRENGVEA